MSRLEAAVRVVLEFSEAFNRHDAPAMAALVAEDFVLEGPSLGAPAVSGRAAAEQHWQELFQRSPAAKIEIEELALTTKFRTLTCSGYVAPSSITTHASPAGREDVRVPTAAEIVAYAGPAPTHFVTAQPGKGGSDCDACAVKP